IEIGPRIESILSAISDRDDKLRVCVGEVNTGGHHADNSPCDAVDPDRMSDHRRRTAVALPPIAIAEHDVVIPAGNRVLGTEKIADCWMDAERVKGIHSHRRAENAFGYVTL